jgi:Fur family ferric uptake transcriptional regulator
MSCHEPRLASLREQGIRMTAQRALILEDLYHHPGHRTAEEIYRRVASRLPGLNRTTIYRTLDLLHDAGIVTTSVGQEGLTEFELVREQGEQHHHLHCRRCGAKLILDSGPVEALKAEIASRYGFRAELDHLRLNGLCSECLAGSDEPIG